MNNRSPGFGNFVTFLLLFTLLFSTPSYAEDLFFSLDKEGKKQTLHFQFEPGSQAAIFPLYLHNRTADIKKGVSLESHLRKEGQVLAGVKVVFYAPGQAKDKGKPFEVAPDKPTKIHLSVSELNRIGKFSGTAQILVGQNIVASPEFTVERDGLPVLKLQQADNQGNVRLKVSSKNYSFPLTLMETGGEAAARVKVSLGPIFREDGVVSESASIDTPNKDIEILIPANGYEVIKITGTLPVPAAYRSWIKFTYGDKPLVYDLYVERQKRPDFIVFGATAKGLSIKAANRRLERPITLQLADGQPEVNDLQISIDATTREDGKAVDDGTLALVSENGPLRLKTGEHLSFTLTGKNLAPGKYLTQLILSSGGRTQLVPIELTCADLAQNITIEAPGATKGIAWLFWKTVDAKFVVNETLGREAEIYLPRLESLQMVSAKNTTAEFTSGKSSLHCLKDNKLIDDHSSCPGASGSDKSISIPPRGGASYVFRISGLDPGKYKGRVAVSGPDIARQTGEFEVFVKRGFYWAFLVIFVSVGASFWLHRYTRRSRENMVRQVNIARTEEAIDRDAAAWPDSDIWQIIRRKITLLKDSVSIEKKLTKAQFDASLDHIKELHRLSLLALRQQTRIRRVLQDYPDFLQEKKELFQKQLNDRMAEFVAALGNLAENGSEKEPGTLALVQNLTDIFNEAQKQKILVPAQMLLEEIKRIKSLEHVKVVQIDDIESEVKKICELAQKGELIGLDSRLKDVYLKMVKLRQDELKQLLDQIEESRAASNHGDAHWQAFDQAVIKVKESLHLVNVLKDKYPEILSVLRQTNRLFQLVLIEHLDVLSDVSRPSDIKKDQWDAWKNEYGLTPQIDKARKAHKAGNESDTVEAYEEAKGQYLKMQVDALNQRIVQLKERINKAPTYANEIKWAAQLKQDPLKRQIEALTRLKRSDEDGLAALEGKFLKARNDYMKTRVAVLRTAFDTAETQKPSPLEPAIKAQVEKAKNAIEDAETKLKIYIGSHGPGTQKVLVEADQAGVTAQDEYTLLADLDPDDTRGLTRKITARQQAPAAVGTYGEAPNAVSSGALQTPPPEVQEAAAIPSSAFSPDEMIRKIKTWDMTVSIFTTLLASFGGLIVLYVPNETWGSLPDFLIAGLWGFGLHEAGNGIIENLTNKGLWPKEQ